MNGVAAVALASALRFGLRLVCDDELMMNISEDFASGNHHVRCDTGKIHVTESIVVVIQVWCGCFSDERN